MAGTKLERLLLDLKKAEEAVLAELERLYPEGTQVRVTLAVNQRVPSNAIVWGRHPGGRDGSLRVKLVNSPKQMVRDISCRDVERGWY